MVAIGLIPTGLESIRLRGLRLRDICDANELINFQHLVGMLNVKLQIEHGDTKFEIIGEVQITTVGYLQLRGGSLRFVKF